MGARPERESAPPRASGSRIQCPDSAITDESPITDPLGRLAFLLRKYERDDVWLHLTRAYRLTSQHAQVAVTITDNQRTLLREGSGRCRSHTFHLKNTVPGVEAGHRFNVAREGTDVRVMQMPACCSQ